jgi:hypothetical protein
VLLIPLQHRITSCTQKRHAGMSQKIHY